MESNDPSARGGCVLHVAWVRWWSALAYYAYSLAEAMPAAGVRTKLVAPPGTPLADRARRLGILATEFNGLTSHRPDRLLRSVRSLRRAARHGEITGLFAHTGLGHASSALALRNTQVPVLRTRAEIRPPSAGPLQRWLYTRATDRVLVSGDFQRRQGIEKLHLDPSRVATLPAGIPILEIDPVARERARRDLRERFGWPSEVTVVGMLARYSPVKGHHDLVEAAARLEQEGLDLRYYLAGSPGQTGRDRVERWVREAGLADRFAVLDAVDDPQRAALAFDIAVIASRGSEAVCRSALEYMALGLPIVATRVHVVPETVGEAALLIRPGVPEDLAKALRELHAKPELRLRIGEEARRRVRAEFDLGRIASRAVGILEAAREERKSR